MSNVRVKVSWATVAETMGGAPPDLVEGAGHEGDAWPEEVQLRVAGLGAVCGVVAVVLGDVCALDPFVPQALSSIKPTMTSSCLA